MLPVFFDTTIKGLTFCRVQAWETTPIVYFITTQLAACFTAYVNIHARLLQYQYTLWRNLSTAVDYFGLLNTLSSL